jgi:dihydrofolate synthase / folylpolyglutamate synthase
MVADSVDEPFFREWLCGRKRGAKRSKIRAQAFLEAAVRGLKVHPSPACRGRWVQGKRNHCCIFIGRASRCRITGWHVDKLRIRSHRERIRVDGRPIMPTEFSMLAMTIAETLERCGSGLPDDGYLSPTGLFTMAGILHFLDIEAYSRPVKLR